MDHVCSGQGSVCGATDTATVQEAVVPTALVWAVTLFHCSHTFTAEPVF